MVKEIIKSNDLSDKNLVSELLERHEDYYSLKRYLSPKTKQQIARLTTVIAGTTIPASLSYILDDIDRLEEDWFLK